MELDKIIAVICYELLIFLIKVKTDVNFAKFKKTNNIKEVNNIIITIIIFLCLFINIYFPLYI